MDTGPIAVDCYLASTIMIPPRWLLLGVARENAAMAVSILYNRCTLNCSSRSQVRCRRVAPQIPWVREKSGEMYKRRNFRMHARNKYLDLLL